MIAIASTPAAGAESPSIDATSATLWTPGPAPSHDAIPVGTIIVVTCKPSVHILGQGSSIPEPDTLGHTTVIDDPCRAYSAIHQLLWVGRLATRRLVHVLMTFAWQKFVCGKFTSTMGCILSLQLCLHQVQHLMLGTMKVHLVAIDCLTSSCRHSCCCNAALLGRDGSHFLVSG